MYAIHLPLLASCTILIASDHIILFVHADDLEEAEREEEAKLQAQAEREAGEWFLDVFCPVCKFCVSF